MTDLEKLAREICQERQDGEVNDAVYFYLRTFENFLEIMPGLTPAELLWLRDNAEAVKACVRGEAGVFEIVPSRMDYYEEKISVVGNRLDKPAKEGRDVG